MQCITYEKYGDHIGLITINRPKSLNALNRNVLEELKFFLTHNLEKDNLRVLIITGKGEKAFIAGADIKEMAPMSHIDMLSFSQLGLDCTNLLAENSCITIAAVNGFALGGGLEIALACDFIYCSDNGRFGLPEVTLGLIPGFGGTQRLSRAVGTRRAIELVTTGKHIDAQEAFQYGLVNKVTSQEKLLEECLQTAQMIVKNAPVAISQGKQAIRGGINIPLSEALLLEKNMCAVAFATEDRLEGMKAFIEKRKPKFS